MQRMVFSKTNLAGPGRFSATPPALPNGETAHASVTPGLPTLLGDSKPLIDFSPLLSAGGTASTTLSNLVDGDPSTLATLSVPTPGRPVYFQLTFAQPYAASVLRLTGGKTLSRSKALCRLRMMAKHFIRCANSPVWARM